MEGGQGRGDRLNIPGYKQVTGNNIYIYIYIYIYMCVCVCVCVTPADQMSDKSGFDIWREHHLKPDGMILVIFTFVWKINL